MSSFQRLTFVLDGKNSRYEYILRKLSPTRPPGPRRPDLLAEIEDEIEDDSKGWWAVALAGGVAGVVSWTVSSLFSPLCPSSHSTALHQSLSI